MEITPHEGKFNNQLHGKVYTFSVISVDENARTVEISINDSNGGLEGGSRAVKAVRQLGLSNHIDGSEGVHLPNVGAVGVLIYVGAIPFILGYFNPGDPESLVTDEKNLNKNRNKISAGDTIFQKRAKNFIALRNYGAIELQSTPLLKMLLLPDRGELSVFTQNHDFLSNAGSVVWSTVDKEKTTNFTAVIKDQVGATKIARIDAGNVVDDHIIKLTTGAPNKYQGIDSPNFALAIKDSGETTVKINDVASLNITDKGATTFTSKLNLNISVEDAIAITAKKTIDVKADQNISITSIKDILAQAENIVMNANTSGKAGAGATEPMVLGKSLLTALKMLVQIFNTHMHMYTDDGSPSATQPPLIPATPIPDSVLSKKWKVE